MIEYRLSWECPSPLQCAAMERQHGKDCWPALDWSALIFYRTSVDFHDGTRLSQYRQLKAWAESREQPIRNVKLEQREAAAWTETTGI